jgi:hypothetical protein
MKRECCWGVSFWVALSGSACGDSSDSPERAVQTVMSADQPSPAPGAGNAVTPAAQRSTALPASPASAAGGAGSSPAMGTEAPSTPSLPPSGLPAAGLPMPPAAPAPASFPGESCDGCARFFLPMTGENQRGDFELDLPAPIDMTAATLRFRLMAAGFTGNAGGVSVYVRDAGNFDKGFVWSNLSALASWTEVTVDFSNTTLAGNMSFDVTKVAKVGVQLNSAGTFAGANFQNATVYLDSVRFSNAPSADLTFSEGIGDLKLVSSDAPVGTTVNFLAH